MIQDLILPLAIVSVVGMMIFPLPTVLLDMLLMCNISFSLALLISCVYLSEPERFTSLPTILLLTTLFRLGLNISTTRQLLGTGEAPEIVTAFGGFVVGGNLLVGVVIFSIVTIVQFLVIAKGAERVAEVAARFTLDAMPGKQMSIDADIRAGILSLTDAREKRADLHRESKLFGALDGAMKFVKGDAIAGLLITVVNIVAGLIVGVTSLKLSLSEAASRFTLFTIGDGLVSQIPALLVAVSAGIAVTRVSEKEGSFLSRDVFSQLAREPQALGTTTFLLLILAIVPGLPSLPFLGMALIFGVATIKLTRKRSQAQTQQDEQKFRPRVYSSLVLRLSLDAAEKLRSEGVLTKEISKLRQRYFDRWGMIIPDLQCELSQDITGVSLLVHGVAERHLSPQADLNLSEAIIHALDKFIEDHLLEFLDDTQTRLIIEAHEAVSEDLINSVIPNQITVTGLTRLLRELLRERVSIKEFPKILQVISECKVRGVGENLATPQTHSANVGLTLQEKVLLAEIRIGLKRTIASIFSKEGEPVHVILIEHNLDQLLTKAVLTGVMFDPILIERLKSGLTPLVTNDRSIVLMSSSLSRAGLSEYLGERIPGLILISPGELPADAPLKVIGEFTAEGIKLVKPQLAKVAANG
jgi:type III secretory pathway component EscV